MLIPSKPREMVWLSGMTKARIQNYLFCKFSVIFDSRLEILLEFKIMLGVTLLCFEIMGEGTFKNSIKPKEAILILFPI